MIIARQLRLRTSIQLISKRGKATVPLVRRQRSDQVESSEHALAGGPGPRDVAMPKPPPSISPEEAPNRTSIWSKSMNTKLNAMRGPRFEQTNMDFQPFPLAAIEMIGQEPIRLVDTRIASCDGGGGALGHPKVFINLDKPGSKACGYCGLRFERNADHAHHGH